ncbi:hypothetical protein F4778DRAFT_581063 [Xylariomycetidae sp. FL2044]|nr:hypothetical protein F4778DRAFT_581063 [Xylariomycetidae sp. FL2044]
MEGAKKSIESLSKQILPVKAHYLSLSPTRRYRPHPDEKRLEEQDIRPLQYTTFVSDADRGVLLTRAYFDVREDPVPPNHAMPTPTPRGDPNKPKTKLSLKDYKNRKTEGDSPPKSANLLAKSSTQREKEFPIKKPLEPPRKDMDGRRDDRKDITRARKDTHRQRSPSPERKKRVSDADESFRPAKRSKLETATPNGVASRSLKEATPLKTERCVQPERKIPRDGKLSAVPNGRPPLGSNGARGVSPRPNAQVNGAQKSAVSNHTSKKTESNSTPTSKPSLMPLLSPLPSEVSDLVREESKLSRPSPKKKPVEITNSKPSLQRLKDDREPSPGPKKRRIPPLLSPTLPAIVMEELERAERRTPSKDTGQKSSQTDSSVPPKRALKAPADRETTIHVDRKKDESETFMVILKYKKRQAKTVERLLALPPVGKKKSEGLKREDRAVRDRSDSVEPGTARKRPRTGADASEAIKRPKTSENVRPSTPPKQSAAMTRVTSNSSQAGTPGDLTSLTPASQVVPERRRPPLDPEALQRLHKLQARSRGFIELGRKLKHERDALIGHGRDVDRASDRDRQIAMGAGTQSLLSFMHGFMMEAEAHEIERGARRIGSWKDMMPWMHVVRNDCNKHKALSALLLRIQGICLNSLQRAIMANANPHDPKMFKELQNSWREQNEVWRHAQNARNSLGVYTGAANSDDGGPVGKLIDRLSPFTTPEEAIPISLEILRRIMRPPWKPAEELSRVGLHGANGASSNR